MNGEHKITGRHLERKALIYLLTELRGVSPVQDRCRSRQPIVEMSGRSESPGRRYLAASPIPTETGHTGLNQSPTFSSLPIFDVSCSEPRALLQRP